MIPITIEEVDLVLEDTTEGKSSGSDDFTTDFFHHCWPMVREEFLEIIEDSRASGEVLPYLNSTFLTLIPKEEWVTHPKYFRSIALCKAINKILTKVVSRCIKPLLPFIIFPKKSSYVDGRKILDNVILVHEFIHSL